MKVSIEEIAPNEDEEILIRCHKINNNILGLLHRVKTSQDTLIGLDGEQIYRLKLEEVYYFETVDNKSFIYCKNKVYESKLKLYEFLRICEGTHFFRASKSVILNSDMISYIKPSFSGRFEATLLNDEKVMISRQFVVDLKKCLEYRRAKWN